MTSSPFLLDANVFIQAHQKWYAFDICPGFWNCLSHHGGDSVLSIDRVYDEIKEGDKLHSWVKTAPDGMFASTKEVAITNRFQDVMAWVNSENFLPAAKAEFADAADGWLAAYALAKGGIVVTHEGYNPDRKNKVLLGNVCRHFKVERIDTFEFLRRLPAALQWSI